MPMLPEWHRWCAEMVQLSTAVKINIQQFTYDNRLTDILPAELIMNNKKSVKIKNTALKFSLCIQMHIKIENE